MRRIILLLSILLLAALPGACRQETAPEVIVITALPTPVVATDSVAPIATTASPSTILGLRCAFAGTGATLAVGDKRANFTCSPADDVVLLGEIVLADRGWEVEKAVIGQGDSGFTAQLSEMVAVTQVELVDGTVCSFAGTGATLAIGDKRANFTCTPGGDVVLLGDTVLSDSGWEIEKAVLSSSDSSFAVQSLEMVQIAALIVPAATTAAPAEAQPPASQGVNRPIQFAAGATSATVENTAVAGTSDRYALRAQAGQTMWVELSSTDNNTTFLVEAPNGQLLTGGTAGAVLDQWEGQLPVSGDYAIVIRSTAGDASYHLVVTIPPLAPQGVNQRIQFAAGATSATVEGNVLAGAVDRYTLGAQAGQTLRVELSSDGYATLLLEAPNGQLLTAGAVLDQWEGQLQVSGDYVILVRTTIGDASYRLAVTIPPLADEPASGGRIEFAPGATSATYSGFLEASGIGVRYFFTAAAGQTITIDFTPAATLDVSMMGPDNSYHVDNDAGLLETVLPQTGEYILDVIATGADYSVQYQFTITIQ